MAKALFSALSKSGNTIELAEETWQDKICQEHPEFRENEEYPGEVKKAIEKPDYLVKGWAGELLALRWCDIAPGAPKYICVVYREIRNEGFIITSFFISRYGKLLKRGIIWQKD